jgi:glycerate-2-kinase
LLALEAFEGDWVAVSAGTDGSDFLPEVAGAIVDNSLLRTAREKKIDIKPYLERFDSNTLLKKLGNSLIVTGSTGTNVCDVMVYILKHR